MRALLPVCAGIAVVSSIAAGSLWHELRSERQVNETLRTQLTEAQSRISNPALASFPAAANAAVPGSATTSPSSAATTAPAAAGKTEAPAARPAQSAAVASLESSMALERDLMKDPEYRKLRLAQTRMNMSRNYPGLAEELGLTEKEAEKLFDLLAENQVSQSAETQLFSINGTQDQAAMQEMSRRLQAMQREQEDAVRNLLGPGKYTQWQDYQQTRPARSRVTSLAQQLAQAGAPLNDAQTRSLTAVMIAEQQRQRQDMQTQALNRSQLNPADPEYRTRMLEDSFKRTEENNRRMLEAAAPHLSAKQLAAAREQMEQQAAMSRISLRMQLERERLQPPAATSGSGSATIVVPSTQIFIP